MKSPAPKLRGRPPGHHTEWRPKEVREAEKAERLQRGPRVPLDQTIEEWPGPFKKRPDFPSVRPAFWVNCAFCTQLFVRSVTEAKSSNELKRKSHRGNVLVCSIACGKSYYRAPVMRVCSYCSKTFRVWAENRHKRTCCYTCLKAVQSEHHKGRMSMPLIAYAYERGILADRMLLTCDYCGEPQRIVGKTTHMDSKHYKVRVAEINGKYVARCQPCADQDLKAHRQDLADMTPAQRLRYEQAQELISEVIAK